MRAIFVFCEGAHDVHFLARSLRMCGEYTAVDKVQDFPPPLSGFLKMRLENEQSKLAAFNFTKVTHLLLPRLEVVMRSPDDSRFVMFFVCEGGSQHKNNVELLKDLEKALRGGWGQTPQPGQATKPRVDGWATLLCFDADDKGVEGCLQEVRDKYGAHFGDLARLGEATWLATQKGPLACVVFRGDSGTGTLEDILMPMFQARRPDELAAAGRFVDATMWDGSKLKPNEQPPTVAVQAKRKKAALTILGQFDHPSCSLAVFLKDTKELTEDALKAHPLSAAAAALIHEAGIATEAR